MLSQNFWLKLVAFCIVGVANSGCTKDRPRTREPVSVTAEDPSSSRVSPPGSSSLPSSLPSPQIQAADPCVAYGKMPGEPPQTVPNMGIVVTRMLKPCVTRDGHRGYFENSPWMAMGFPCTGTEGRVDWKGTNYLRPKMASFIVSTDCGMAPPDPKDVVSAVTQAFGFPASAPLLAYNPFVVQYWEIPVISEADTGFTVDLRTNEAVEKVWPKLVKGEPLRVRLVGRENAWVAGDNLYIIEADLFVTQKNRFRLQVFEVKVLDPESKEAVKSRCEALRPRRNCLNVF